MPSDPKNEMWNEVSKYPISTANLERAKKAMTNTISGIFWDYKSMLNYNYGKKKEIPLLISMEISVKKMIGTSVVQKMSNAAKEHSENMIALT